MFVMRSNIELFCTIALVVGYIGCGVEPRKGSIRTIWEMILLGTLLNIGRFLLGCALEWDSIGLTFSESSFVFHVPDSVSNMEIEQFSELLLSEAVDELLEWTFFHCNCLHFLRFA